MLENVTVLQLLTSNLPVMHTKIQWHNNVHFTAVGDSGHAVEIDGAADTGGENLGSRPMELMLMGLGGCTSFDVIQILRKSRQTVTDCVTQVTASRTQTIPQVFETIHLHFVICGENLDERKVARAISLSADKYCSASIMLERGGVQITHDYEVHQV